MGVLLAEVMLRDDEKARMSGRDLPNAYHHALVSMLRARTYALGALYLQEKCIPKARRTLLRAQIAQVLSHVSTGMERK